ncbi:hypothetical protein VSR69_04120 [Paraburkholderia phytofirmans]|uniref:hypothetical protein n=1 Tax=Paraburkholderia sp. BL9I2N2 TaxID=1938809 RepID=UPI001051D1A2|nr:hypothetical protein [Paraburkholderia sp. BL9I2N2]TCK96379.1 hypothetical protein B0G74_3045 [Paraburkholderia sp. BL9I2N2]
MFKSIGQLYRGSPPSLGEPRQTRRAGDFVATFCSEEWRLLRARFWVVASREQQMSATLAMRTI